MSDKINEVSKLGVLGQMGKATAWIAGAWLIVQIAQLILAWVQKRKDEKKAMK